MKTISTLFASALVVLFASCSDVKQNESSDNNSAGEKNKMAMKKVFEAFETGNTDSLGNYVAENCVEHTPMPEMKSTGLQGLKDMIAMHRTAYPDMKCTVLSMIAEGDMVAAHINMKGTNTGAFGNMPATNKSVDFNGVDIVRFENGKGVEHWGYMEEAKMMQQLGMMPEANKMHADSTMKEMPAEKKK